MSQVVQKLRARGRGGCAGADIATQGAELLEPGTEVRGKLLVELAAEALGEGWAFAGGGDGDLQIAAGDGGSEIEIAVGESSTPLQRMPRVSSS